MTTPERTSRALSTSRLRGPLAVVAGVIALILCVDVGVRASADGFDFGTLVRIALIVGGLLAVLWLARFDYFLLTVLVVRPALDISKTGGGPAVLSSSLAALVVLGVLLWLAAQLRATTLQRVSVLGRLLVLLLAVMTLSALGADDTVRSALQVARLAAAVAVFLAVEQLARGAADRHRVLLACFASALVPLVVGVQQLATGSFIKESDGLGRVTGTFLHPNAFGFYLVLLLIMGTAVVRHLEGRAAALVAAVLVLGAAALVLTYSRGSWIAAVIGLLVLGVLHVRALLLLVPAALLALPLAAPSVLLRLSDLTRTESINGTPGNSFLWRVDHWAVVLRGARGHELFGLGPGSADFLGDDVLPPHNDFVRMYVETGVLGTTVYVACLVAALVLAASALRAVPAAAPVGTDALRRGIGAGATACTIAFVVGSVGGNLISEVVVLLYFFAFLGLASGVRASARTGADEAGDEPRPEARSALPARAGGVR